MTSWISKSLPKKKVAPEPIAIFPSNQGSFVEKTEEATVVTAWYDLPSPVSFARQRDQMQKFLQTVPCQVCIFTQPSLADTLAEFREGLEDRTRVIVLEPKEWVSTTKFIASLWSQQVKQDPEIRLGRTVEDFQFGYEKKEFMTKAVGMNPFHSTDFVWINPSYLWDCQFTVERPAFPVAAKIPIDRIVVSNPEPFVADDLASSYFRGKNRVENTLLAGSGSQWKEYSKLYDVVMSQKLKVSGFIGDDLLMLHYMCIHKPNQFCLVRQESLLDYFSR